MNTKVFFVCDIRSKGIKRERNMKLHQIEIKIAIIICEIQLKLYIEACRCVRYMGSWNILHVTVIYVTQHKFSSQSTTFSNRFSNEIVVDSVSELKSWTIQTSLFLSSSFRYGIFLNLPFVVFVLFQFLRSLFCI